MSKYYRILHLPTGTYLHCGNSFNPKIWDFLFLSSAQRIISQYIVVYQNTDLVMLHESMKYYGSSAVLREHLEIVTVEVDD